MLSHFEMETFFSSNYYDRKQHLLQFKSSEIANVGFCFATWMAIHRGKPIIFKLLLLNVVQQLRLDQMKKRSYSCWFSNHPANITFLSPSRNCSHLGGEKKVVCLFFLLLLFLLVFLHHCFGFVCELRLCCKHQQNSINEMNKVQRKKMLPARN